MEALRINNIKKNDQHQLKKTALSEVAGLLNINYVVLKSHIVIF